MNLIIITGNLVDEPKVKTGTRQDGSAYEFVTGRIAWNPSSRTSSEKPIFLSFSANGNQGNFIKNYCHKGSRLNLTGSLRNNDYPNQEGNIVWSLSMNVINVEFAMPKTDNQNHVQQTQNQQVQQVQQSQQMQQPMQTQMNNYQQNTANQQPPMPPAQNSYGALGTNVGYGNTLQNNTANSGYQQNSGYGNSSAGVNGNMNGFQQAAQNTASTNGFSQFDFGVDELPFN